MADPNTQPFRCVECGVELEPDEWGDMCEDCTFEHDQVEEDER